MLFSPRNDCPERRRELSLLLANESKGTATPFHETCRPSPWQSGAAGFLVTIGLLAAVLSLSQCLVSKNTGFAAEEKLAPARVLPGPGSQMAAFRMSPWIPKLCELPYHHKASCEMQANVEFDFEDGGDTWSNDERHVDGPDRCCAICQGHLECKAWIWVRNAGLFKNWYRCFLKGDKPSGTRARNGVISGLPPPRHQLRPHPKIEEANGTSLYCFALMRPASSEQRLLEMQEKHGISIFSCDEAAVYSNQAIQIGKYTSIVINSNLKCKSGGDFGKALNSWIFIEVWREVINNGRYYNYNWTVKADPDAAFFPNRLKTMLADHLEAGYVNNCPEGMHGPIEVLSRKAVGALAWDYRNHENKTFPIKCVHAQELSRWGEDMFLDKCLMDTLEVKREFDVRLMCEEACGCPDWFWCQNGTERVTFHPFKTTQSYRNCVANAMAGAAPMPPPPRPCAELGEQCGGKGWRGATCCAQGLTCTKKNSFYSTCKEGCAGPLKQCGGKTWKGVTCCSHGYMCIEKDEWYSQCRPPWSPEFPSESSDEHAPQEVSDAVQSPGTVSATAPQRCADLEEQCGGDGFQGTTCCTTGHTCNKKNRWFWQCDAT